MRRIFCIKILILCAACVSWPSDCLGQVPGSVFHSIRNGDVVDGAVEEVSSEMICDSVSVPSSPGVRVCLPLDGVRMTSPFGMRTDPIDGKSLRRHSGVDLQARFQPVFAMMDGVVLEVGSSRDGGMYVTLLHDGFSCSYLHLSRVLVHKGDWVCAGLQVAVSGNSGRRSTGPHLHVSCRWCLPGSGLDGKFFDPWKLIVMIREVSEGS